MGLDALFADRKVHLVRSRECGEALLGLVPFFLRAQGVLGNVVATKSDVLARSRNRTSIARPKNIVRGQHEQPGFQLSFHAQRNVYRHLVTVEVRIISGTNQRMNSNGISFDQLRFKGLNRQAMQRGSTIQENRMFPSHFV